jgi:CDP-glucose 4,6-dehydratase
MAVVNKNYWQRRNVLITGCSGLVGGWLTKELVEAGADVVGIVRDWVPQALLHTVGLYQQIRVARGSIEDREFVTRVLNEYEIDTVFHLAAQTIVGTANRNPVSTFEANICGTWSVLEACRHVSTVRRIVLASSDKAYGDQQHLPYDENTALEGRHPYDVSKSCADLIAQSYHATYGLPVCITRCGNFYGGGDLNFNRLVPGTIRSIVADERPQIRSDGQYVRDYFYVRDGVGAYLLLAEKMDDEEIWGEAFNFSNEIQVTVLELTRRILALMEREDLVPEVLGEAKNEILHQYLTAQKARGRLDWAPSYSLDEGLKETIDWYKTHLKDRD